jgi:hypothetical protein
VVEYAPRDDAAIAGGGPKGLDPSHISALGETVTGRKVVSWETVEKSGSGGRKPIALGFIVDCTGSMSTIDPSETRFSGPGKLAEVLGKSDKMAFASFTDHLTLNLGWTPGDKMAGKVPTSVGSGGGTDIRTSTTLASNLFSDRSIAGSRRIAVCVSDVEPPDNAIVLNMATRLSAKGVTVYVTKFGSASVDPELRRVCAKSGGQVFDSPDVSGISEALKKIGLGIATKKKTHHKYLLTFTDQKPHRVGEKWKLSVSGHPAQGTIVSCQKL